MNEVGSQEEKLEKRQFFMHVGLLNLLFLLKTELEDNSM